MEFVHPTTDPTPAQPRNIDVWRAHAAKKKAAGQPFFSTSPRVPAPSFETTSTVRGAAAGPPNIRNPFDDKSTLATDEMLAEWTLQKEAGNVHFSSGEYKEASKTYMETLQAMSKTPEVLNVATWNEYPHPDDTEMITLYTTVLGNFAECLLRGKEIQEHDIKRTLRILSYAKAFDKRHAKNNVRFVRAHMLIPGRVMTNELMRHCLYSLNEEQGREGHCVKLLIHKCRRRLENVHWEQLGPIRGAGPTELLIPGKLADGTQITQVGQLHQTHDEAIIGEGLVLDARFALGIALEMNKPESCIARRVEDLLKAERWVETNLGVGPLRWDSPDAYMVDFPDMNKTQFFPGFLGSENCGPTIGNGSEVLM